MRSKLNDKNNKVVVLSELICYHVHRTVLIAIQLLGIIVCVCVCMRMCAVTQLCPNPCDPIDCSSPGSSVHGIFQERLLE